MRILTYNIGHAVGKWSGYHDYALKFWRFILRNKKTLHGISDIIQDSDPDLVFLVEIKKFAFANQFKILKDKMAYPHAIFWNRYGKVVRHMPYFKDFGCAVFSKVPVLQQETLFFSKGFKKAFLRCKLANGTTVYFLHLPLGKDTRSVQLIHLAKTLAQHNERSIVVGDFNTFTGDAELKDLMKKGKLFNPHTNSLTFPQWKPTKTLDYILVPKGTLINNAVVVECPYSDHRPLLVDVQL